MGDDFKLPPGEVFPPNTLLTERPRNKSIDTPALKLDTSIVVSVMETNADALPPPPERRPQANSVGKEETQPQPKNAVEKSDLPNQNPPSPESTPVMRSIFPRLDASVRLSQQPYVPAIVPEIQQNPPPTAHYSPSLYSQPQSPPQVFIPGDPWSSSRIPSAVFQQSPLRVVQERASNLSTSEQLLDLWTIAEGEKSDESVATYMLALRCDSLQHDHEKISLTSDTDDLYTIEASGPTMVITRKHPVNPSTSITIATPTFRKPTTTSPLLTSLLPALAEFEALETAQRIAIEHQLTPKDSTQLQIEAVNRAKSTEAGALLWDSDSSRYYFTMPSLQARAGQAITPTPLTIIYTPNESIRFLNKMLKPLLELNLVDYSLKLVTNAIVGLSSSKYTLDILLSALLALSLHLHRQDGLLTEPTLVAPHFDPPPRVAQKVRPKSSSRSLTANPRPQSSLSTSPWLSRLNPLSRTSSRLSQTSHIPLDNNPTATFDKDIELGSGIGSTVVLPHHIAPMTTPSIAPGGIAPELRASNTGVDLSKFQAYDLEDPNLASGTKLVLRLIYWLFAVIVWVLGVFVGVIAALVVGLGACFGGGRGSREG